MKNKKQDRVVFVEAVTELLTKECEIVDSKIDEHNKDYIVFRYTGTKNIAEFKVYGQHTQENVYSVYCQFKEINMLSIPNKKYNFHRVINSDMFNVEDVIDEFIDYYNTTKHACE